MINKKCFPACELAKSILISFSIIFGLSYFEFTAYAEWSALETGTNERVKCIAFDGTGKLYAGGLFTLAGSNTVDHLAVWDGTTWSAFGDGLKGGVNAIGIFEGTIYVGGSFSKAGEAPANYVAKWNGSSWEALGEGPEGIVNTLAFSDGNLYIGGNFDKVASIDARGVAKWDGKNWFSVGGGVGGQNLAVNED